MKLPLVLAILLLGARLLAQQPETLPDKYESGNLNVPGIVGLKAVS